MTNSTMTNSASALNNIHSKLNKIFQNPNINFFIIMLLILLISCYTFINISLKFMISSYVSNPIVILFVLIFVILIGFYNINIAVLVLLLLFIILYGTTIFNNKNSNKIEGFTNNSNYEDDSDNDSDSDSDDENDYNKEKFLNTTTNDESKSDETVSKIKDALLGNMHKIKDNGESEYQKSLLENKQIQYRNEKKIF